MPLELLTEGLLGGILRVLAWFFIEIVLHILVRGLGYLICRPFSRVELDSGVATLVGIMAWVLIGVLIHQVFTSFV